MNPSTDVTGKHSVSSNSAYQTTIQATMGRSQIANDRSSLSNIGETATATAAVDLSQYRSLLETYQNKTDISDFSKDDCCQIVGMLLRGVIDYSDLPESVRDSQTFAIRLLSIHYRVLAKLPSEWVSDNRFIKSAVQRVPALWGKLDHRYTYDLSTVIRLGNVNINPYSLVTIRPSHLDESDLEKSIESLSQFSSAIASNIVASLYINKYRLTREPYKDVLIELENLILKYQKSLSPASNAALATAFSPIGSEKLLVGKQSSFVKDLYRDERCKVVTLQPAVYIQTLYKVLKAIDVNVYQVDALTRDADLVKLFQEDNSILFLTQRNLEQLGAGLNGLLEEGSWTLNLLSGTVAARIVLVLDHNYEEKDDMVSRMACHIDALSLMIPTAPLPAREKPSQAEGLEDHQAKERSTKTQGGEGSEKASSRKHSPKRERNPATDIKIHLELDRQTLLDEKYQTVQSIYAKGGLSEDRALLVSAPDELQLLKLPREQLSTFKIVVPASVLYSDYQGSDLVKTLPPEHALPYTLFILDAITEVDRLVELFISHNKPEGKSIRQFLSECDVYVNSANGTECYRAVSVAGGTPRLEYLGEEYDVKSLQRSALSVSPDKVQVSERPCLMDRDQIEYFASAYRNGTVFTESRASDRLFDALVDLVNGRQLFLNIEGGSGIGKDSLTRHFLSQLQRCFPDRVLYLHTTAAFDRPLLDQLVDARKENPNKRVVLLASEANVYSPSVWSQLFLFMLQDGDISIVGSSNPADFGGRYPFPNHWPKITLPDFSEKEQVHFIAFIGRKKRIPLTYLPRNCRALSMIHDWVKDRSTNKPNLRQLNLMISLLPKKGGISLDRVTLQETFTRVYGSYLRKEDYWPIDALKAALTPVIIDKSNWSRENDNSTLRNFTANSSLFSNDYPDRAGENPWEGVDSALMTSDFAESDILNLEIGDRQRKVGHAMESKEALPSKKSMQLLTFPGKLPKVVPISLRGRAFKTSAVQIESKDNGNLFLKNIRREPIKLRLEFCEVPKRFSQTMKFTGIERQAQTIKPQERTLLKQIVKYISGGVETDDVSIQKSELLKHFDVPVSATGEHDDQVVVQKIFHWFKCYAKGTFEKTPMVAELERAYLDLYHSFINRCGVCKEQAVWIDLLLRYFDLPSTVESNPQHAFALLDRRFFMDVDYFKSVAMRDQYLKLATLVEEHKQRMALKSADSGTEGKDEAKTEDEVKTESVDAMALKAHLREAEFLLCRPKVSGIPAQTLNRLVQTLTIDREAEGKRVVDLNTLKRPNLSNPESSEREAKRARTDASGQAHAKIESPLVPTSPEQLIADLLAEKMKISDIPKQMAKQKQIPLQGWISACSLTDRQDEIVGEDNEEAQMRKCLKLIPADQSVEEMKREALKAIFYQMISTVPSGSKTVRYFVPHSHKRIRIPYRGIPVPGGQLVRYEKPAPNFNADIRITPTEKFTKPYWLLTKVGAKRIASQEGQQKILQQRDQLYVVSRRDAALLQSILDSRRGS